MFPSYHYLSSHTFPFSARLPRHTRIHRTKTTRVLRSRSSSSPSTFHLFRGAAGSLHAYVMCFPAHTQTHAHMKQLPWKFSFILFSLWWCVNIYTPCRPPSPLTPSIFSPTFLLLFFLFKSETIFVKMWTSSHDTMKDYYCYLLPYPFFALYSPLAAYLY